MHYILKIQKIKTFLCCRLVINQISMKRVPQQFDNKSYKVPEKRSINENKNFYILFKNYTLFSFSQNNSYLHLFCLFGLVRR